MSEELFEFDDNIGTTRSSARRPLMYKITETGCYHIVSHKKDQDGYTRILRRIDGKRKMLYLHRVAYEQVYGEIPEGKVIMHSCDNPACINPHHLSAGSNYDNIQDKVNKGRQNYGARNGRAKLTEDDIRAIRQDERIARLIGADFGITTTHVYYIKSGKNWSHVV